ncbi:MAG: RNA polymerase sigma factor [Steroidobacteraceae bacterium]|jgi:RNA polymerase sigma-70 factor (ECF subfamily)
MSDVTHLDLALARRVLAGDEAAFRALFEGQFARLYRFALARVGGDAALAEDIVQQTFCRAIEHLDAYRGEAALYTWFCQICRNIIVDHWRARGREAATVVPLEDRPEVRAIIETLEAPAILGPETEVWRRDLRRLVQATVDALPERYGDVLEWKYVEGLSVADIATRLAVSVKAAESLLGRARTAFRDGIVAMAETADVLRPL